jgi:large subunit ribosomal protein L20
MSRVKSGKTTRAWKKKIFRRAKGYRMGKSKLYRHATEQVDKSLDYAYRDRRAKKGISVPSGSSGSTRLPVSMDYRITA